MGDQLDDIMASRLPEFKREFDKAITASEKSQVLPVDILTGSTPYRVETRWKASNILPDDDRYQIERCDHSGGDDAYELIVRAPELLDRRGVEGLEAADSMLELATDSRAWERRFLLKLLLAADNYFARMQYSGRVLEDAIHKFNLRGPFRLLGTTDVVKAAKDISSIEETVDMTINLPDGVVGLLFPTINGPRVQRLESDLTLSWRRRADHGRPQLDDRVELCASGRFFVTSPHRCCVLERLPVSEPAQGVKAG